AESHRPDRIALVVFGGAVPARMVERGAVPGRIIEPDLVVEGRIAINAEAPHAPAGISEVPAIRRALELSRTVADMHARIGVEADGREIFARRHLDVEKIRAALNAMVVMAEVAAVRQRDAMDHPGLEIGGEQLLVVTIVGEIAERGAAIRTAVEHDLRKGMRR